MKKLLVLAFAIILVISCFAGCEKSPENNIVTDITESEPIVTEPPTTRAPATEPPVTDAPETDAPETDAPVTDAPVTDTPETDAPVTDTPETDAPVTDAPVTDAPETDAPVTDTPETDAPIIDPVTTAADSPISSYDFVKFVPQEKNDPNCTVGFVLQAKKYTHLGNDLILIHITNTTDTDYSISLTVKYLDENGGTIKGLRDKVSDFGAGWDNYYIYDPDFAFDSFSCSMSISSPCQNSVTKYLASGDSKITFSTENSGYAWLDRQTGNASLTSAQKAAFAANFPLESGYSESLHYIASYILFDENGNIIFYDNTRIPGIIALGSNTLSTPVYLSNTSWSQKSSAKLPTEYAGNVYGIVSFASVLTYDGSISDSKLATTKEFGYYTYTASNGITMPYRLYLPRNYDSSKKYPVVTVFHANGSQGSDNELQVRDVEKFFGSDQSPIFDCIVLAPQCPEGGWWLGENIDAAVEILDSINAYYSTDKERQYITGTSMGGCAVWNMLSRYPEKVSAAVPCAYFSGFGDKSEMENPIILSDGQAIPREMLDIPIYYIYSLGDDTISPVGCKALVAALENTNAPNFTYAEMENQDHGTLGASYISKYNDYEYLHWLLQQRRETN